MPNEVKDRYPASSERRYLSSGNKPLQSLNSKS